MYYFWKEFELIALASWATTKVALTVVGEPTQYFTTMDNVVEYMTNRYGKNILSMTIEGIID